MKEEIFDDKFIERFSDETEVTVLATRMGVPHVLEEEDTGVLSYRENDIWFFVNIKNKLNAIRFVDGKEWEHIVWGIINNFKMVPVLPLCSGVEVFSDQVTFDSKFQTSSVPPGVGVLTSTKKGVALKMNMKNGETFLAHLDREKPGMKFLIGHLVFRTIAADPIVVNKN